MNIAYVTTYDFMDIKNWSGAGFYISKALNKQNARLDLINNFVSEPGFYTKAKSKMYSVLGKKFLKDRTVAAARAMALHVDRNVKPDSEIIFSPGSIPIAFVKKNRPKVFYTDATFAGMLNFYEGFTNVCSETIKAGNLIEQQALDTCDLAIYASEWAANTALEFYNVSANKIKVVPFGANLECDRTILDIEKIVKERSRTKCQLLFLGVDWERKGGPLVLEIAEQLNRNGIQTELHIAGIGKLPVSSIPAYTTNHGFLDKSTYEGRDKINKLLSTSHFLVLPSKAEAFGLVFGEASSFGVPSISRAIGGITTAIRDNRNGRTFPLEASAKDFADYIENIFLDYKQYEQLAYSSFNEYKSRLNWEVAGKAVMDLLKQL